MPRIIDIQGISFNHFIVLEWVSKGIYKWRCQCSCGKKFLANSFQIRYNIIKSCGCMRDTSSTEVHTTHNMSYSTEYNIYKIMKQRCYNVNATQYEDYGARGITICQRWLDDFKNFYEDMGARPSENHTLERKNNNAGYSKANCYWATKAEQLRNKRNNVWLTFNGKTMTIGDWASDLHLYSSTIRRRLEKGESFEYIYKKFGTIW